MNITSKEVWDTLEVSLIKLKNKNIDEILSDKIESLINHFNSLMVVNKQFETSTAIKSIIDVVNIPTFFKTRNIDKEEQILIQEVIDSLDLLFKILARERKTYTANDTTVKKERLPNVNNDKSLNIFKKVD